MANRTEEEGRRGPSFLQVAAGLGIGYAAYKNRNQLIKGVSGVLKSGKVNLSRATNSASFRGTIGEMKSLSSAVVETYGQASPRNIARAYLHPDSRKAQLNRNLATYNKDLSKRLEINALDDVYQSQQRLGDRNKGNHRKAKRDASIINMRNAANRADGPYRDAFGENFDNVIRMFENNAEWLMKDPAKGLRKTTDANGKEIFDEYNVNIKKLFDEYNYNPKRNINLGIHPRDEESQKAFVRNMMDLSLESYTKTQAQVDEAKYVAKKAGGAVTSKDNVYAQHKQLYDIGLFESVRKTHAEKNSDSFTKLMTENGYSQITMAQARDGVAEERNGKLFLVKSSIDNKGRTIEDRYSTPLRTSSSADTLGLNSKTKSQPFARQYIQAGERMGLDRTDLEQHVFSNQLFLDNKSGEVVNVQGMGKLTNEMGDYFQQNWQIPFLNMNPLDFLPKGTLAKERNSTIFEIYEDGKDFFTFMDQDKYNLRRVDESRNSTSYAKILNQSYMHVDGDIFDTGISKEMSGLTDADAYRAFREKSGDYLVGENYDSVSLRSGMYKHYADVISDRTNIENFDKPGAIKQLFGLGQESETVFGKIKRAVTKFDDPLYAENIVGEIYKRSDQGWSSSEDVVEQAYANLFGRTKNLSPNSKEAVYDVLGDLINRQSNMSLKNMDLYDIKTDDGLMGIAQNISESFRLRSEPETMLDTTQKRIRNNLEREISQQFFGDYMPDQQGFLDRTRYLKSRNVYVPDKMGNVMENETVGVKASDDLRKLIEEYGIALADEKGIDLNKSILSTPGIFPNDVRAEIGELRALGQMDYFNSKTKGNSVKDIDDNQLEWLTFYKNNPENLSNLEYSLAKTDPWYGTGAGEKRDDLLGANKRTPIKKHTTLQESINASLSKAAEEQPFNHEDFNNAAGLAEGIFNWSKQGGTLFAGRHGNITDASVIPWHLANRLDTPLQKLGLGLPNHLKDSPQSILFNQWARRIVLPYAAFQTAVYFDGMTGDATSDAAADTYVNMHEDVNRVKEFAGINNWGRDMQKIMPWGEQIGAIAPVKAFNFATFGLFSDFRTAEDVEKYYTSGEDPIRKGRFWDIGSNSPWMGNKIDRYEANWYRKAKSDYQFSDNMYGSENEYWANNWMPTLTHPFAPIKHFITDPYHYEDKHAESRPYAVTGGFAELQNIPLVGPAIDTVVSGVLKPQRTNRRLKESHQAYLSSYNERLSAAYINMNAGGVVNMGPNGSMTLSSDIFDVNFTDENGQLNEEALIADEMTFNAERDRMAIGLMNSTGVIPQLPGGTMPGGFLGRIFSAVGNGGGGGSVTPVPEDQIAALTETYGEGNVAGVGTVGRSGSASAQYLLGQMNARLTDGKTINRSDQVSQAGTMADPNVLLRLNGAVNQASLFNPNGVMRDITYNAGEFAGMYGFLSKTAFGFEESGRGTTLESSDRFSNYNDKFWENELGGLGGDLSEIGRRYLPRDPNKDYYNPIRNTMPTWLPGAGYFQDFLHGDPYAKVAKGEQRLPGDAYEKLYGVRKDAQGNYSALDRYRILADVAPYSDQYRAAKKEVALLNQNGYLDERQQDEYATIRDQVSSRMKKKNFYAERFQNMDNEKETVTVTQVLDQNTFLTEEYANNPFKLAGVNVKTDDEENKAMISQFIKPGQKLQVSIDGDPLKRVRDDMMDTMRVVVYTPHAAKGSRFGMEGLGAHDNLNYYLSKRTEEYGGTVTLKDDESSIATEALFSEGQLTTGKLTEWMVHDLLPMVPVVNIIADKFLPVKSATEAYADELYSKSWRDWKNPISDWLMPMFDSTAALNPGISFLNGLGIGLLAGKKNKWNKGMGTGIVFGLVSGVRTVIDTGRELTPGRKEIWIPERREREREVDEYFDKIKYIKYKGLYEKAKDDAKKYEGMDLDAYFDTNTTRGKDNKNLKAYLNNKKKWLNIKKDSEDANSENIDTELADIKLQLNEIDGDRPTGEVGPYAALALRYKDEFESTLFGASDTYNYSKTYRALPKKDKEYFTAFAKASPRERQRILELVPENQKRIYQQQFGLKVDKPEDLDKYFDKYNLPGAKWEGWDPGTSLDSIKLKVMRNEGIELTEANYWGDDEKLADQSGVDAIPIRQSLFSTMINTGDLEKALRGAGLKDVRIGMKVGSATEDSFSTSLNIQKDRSEEIKAGMQNYTNYM